MVCVSKGPHRTFLGFTPKHAGNILISITRDYRNPLYHTVSFNLSNSKVYNKQSIITSPNNPKVNKSSLRCGLTDTNHSSYTTSTPPASEQQASMGVAQIPISCWGWYKHSCKMLPVRLYVIWACCRENIGENVQEPGCLLHYRLSYECTQVTGPIFRSSRTRRLLGMMAISAP